MESNAKQLMRLLKLGGQPATAAGLVLCALLRTVRDVACLVTLANATNTLLYGGNFVRALIWMAVAMFSGAPIIASDRYLHERYRIYLRCNLTQKMAEKLENISLAWLDNQSGGHLLSVCTADLEKFINWAGRSMPELIRIGSYTLAAVAYCLTQNVVLTLWILPVVVAIVPLMSLVSRPLEHITAKQRKAASESLQKTQEVLMDPEFIKSYNLEKRMDERLSSSLARRRQAEETGAGLMGIIEGLAYFASYLPGFVAAGAGTYFLLKGQLTAGFLIGFVQIAVQRFGELVPKIGQIVSETRLASASGALMLQFFDAPEQHTGPVTRMKEGSLLEMKDVWFGYQKEAFVLQGVSLHADRGEMIALVGESGCGKSTLLKLIMGIYPDYQGELLFGGSQISQWDASVLQKLIAPVSQQPFLFPFTIAENLGRSDCPEEARMEALCKADLTEFVRGLPDGIHTRIDEQGSNLSGGQRQRMTLARAFLKEAPLILLDEPTSALDTVTESSFQKAFRQMRKGRTVVVVAHRLSTIQEADRIYVMDKGRIVQCGTHEELIHRDGLYRRLYEAQDKQNREVTV